MKTETKIVIVLGVLGILALGAGIAHDMGAFDGYKGTPAACGQASDAGPVYGRRWRQLRRSLNQNPPRGIFSFPLPRFAALSQSAPSPSEVE